MLYIVFFFVFVICGLSTIVVTISKSLALKKQIAAKRPTVFTSLFAEEFPEFSEEMTYTRAEVAIDKWARFSVSPNFKKHLKSSASMEFKSEEGGKEAAALIADKLFDSSPRFNEYLKDNPDALKRAFATFSPRPRNLPNRPRCASERHYAMEEWKPRRNSLAVYSHSAGAVPPQHLSLLSLISL